MSGRHATESTRQVPAIFISSTLAALFVFFALVATQGVLLNVTPIRHFTRVSLSVQGALLTALLCGLPLVFSIPSLQRSMNERPGWIVWVPPAWFLGLDQVMVGNHEPLAMRLAWISLAGVAGAAVAAVATYLWSYRRHRVRPLVAPFVTFKNFQAGWVAALCDLVIVGPR